MEINVFIATIACLSAQVVAKGSLPNGSECTDNYACYSYCCNNNNDAKVKGICVPTEEDKFCLKHREEDELIMISLWAIFLGIIVICGILRQRQISRHKQSLLEIRRKAQEKNNRVKP